MSERTLDRMGANGPERRERPRDGLKPEVVFNPADIARLTAHRGKVLAATSPLLPSVGAPPEQGIALLSEAVKQIADVLRAVAAPAPPPVQAIWLTLDEASARVGLSIPFLMRMIRGGKLPAIRDRAIKILQEDLDNLDNAAELSKWGQKLHGATDQLRAMVAARKGGAA